MQNVHFVARGIAQSWPDLEHLGESDIVSQAQRFRGGINNWIIQSYLRLRESLNAAGVRTSISEIPREDSVNIAHRDSLNRLLFPYHRCYIVAIRADRPPVKVGQWEILQNNLHVDGERQRYMPFWPQPGIICRDAERGTRISTIAYFGRTGTAPVWFHDPNFHRNLAMRGVRFEINENRWFDYSNVDLVLALRAEAPTMLEQKPASKLINAWLAGVPALLGDEPAYANLRQNGLDYLSVANASDVVGHLDKLIGDPVLYGAMIRNGEMRSRQFTTDAIRSRWLNFLLEEVLPDAQEQMAHNRSPGGSWLSLAQNLAVQKAYSKVFKLRYAMEIRVLKEREGRVAVHAESVKHGVTVTRAKSTSR